MADATLTAAELQRALHIDSPDELENAQSLQAAAEIYLENAGVERDYGNALYKQVVVNYIARLNNLAGIQVGDSSLHLYHVKNLCIHSG